jgi:hypothetical protein
MTRAGALVNLILTLTGCFILPIVAFVIAVTDPIVNDAAFMWNVVAMSCSVF